MLDNTSTSGKNTLSINTFEINNLGISTLDSKIPNINNFYTLNIG